MTIPTTAQEYPRAAAGRLDEQDPAAVRAALVSIIETQAALQSSVAAFEQSVRNTIVQTTLVVDRFRTVAADSYREWIKNAFKSLQTFQHAGQGFTNVSFIRACKKALVAGRHDDVLPRLIIGKPTLDRVEALWDILSRCQRRVEEVAMKVPGWRFVRYLRAAVANKSKELKHDRLNRDRIWDRSLDELLESHGALPDALRGLAVWADPESLMIRQEENVARCRVIRGFLADPRRDAKQRTILRFRLQGHAPAEAIRRSGGTWATYQSLIRALRRALRRTA